MPEPVKKRKAKHDDIEEQGQNGDERVTDACLSLSSFAIIFRSQSSVYKCVGPCMYVCDRKAKSVPQEENLRNSNMPRVREIEKARKLRKMRSIFAFFSCVSVC